VAVGRTPIGTVADPTGELDHTRAEFAARTTHEVHGSPDLDCLAGVLHVRASLSLNPQGGLLRDKRERVSPCVNGPSPCETAVGIGVSPTGCGVNHPQFESWLKPPLDFQ
jgi:hypothetical protein